MATISNFNVDPKTHAITAKKPVARADAPTPTTTPSAPEPLDSHSSISFSGATEPPRRQPASSEMADMVDNIAKAEVKSEKLLVEAQGIRAQGNTGGNNPTNLIMLGDALEDHMAVASNVGSMTKADEKVQAALSKFTGAMIGSTMGGILGAAIGSAGFQFASSTSPFHQAFQILPNRFDAFARQPYFEVPKNPSPQKTLPAPQGAEMGHYVEGVNRSQAESKRVLLEGFERQPGQILVGQDLESYQAAHSNHAAFEAGSRKFQ